MQQSLQKNEKLLLKKLRNGDSQAVREWFALHHDSLLGFVLTKVANKQDAEDIVQEVFINSLRQLNLFQENCQLQTWMIAIARHEIADYYRKRYAKSALRALPISEIFGELKAPSSETTDNAALVRSALQQLSDAHRELLLLKYIDGKSVVEIARSIGRTVKSVESELFRARSAFKGEWLEVANQ